MSKPDCLFNFKCDNPTDSGEHDMFAALGGRRKNSKLVCQPCNNHFSWLDSKLAADLKELNGILGVRGGVLPPKCATSLAE